MKIAFIEPSIGNNSGAQKCAQIILGVFLEKSYDVSVFFANLDSGIFNSYKNKYSKVAGFNFDKLWGANLYLKYLGSGKYDSLSMIKKTAYAFYVFIFSFISHLILAVQLKKNGYTHIYTYDLRGLVCVGFIFKALNIKLIWHLHSDVHMPTLAKKIIFKIPDVIIVPSMAVKKSLGEYHNVKVVYNGFSINDLNSNDENKKEKKESFDIVYVGSLVPHKGFHNLLKALNSDLFLKYNINLNVVGEFGCELYKDYIINLLEDGKYIKVNLLGWRSDAVKCISDSDLLVFPSVISQTSDFGYGKINIKSSEALPTVIIEALSNSVPVVATPTPGVDEIITHMLDGIILISDSVDDIKNGVITAINHSFTIENKNIMEKFSLSRLSDEMDDLLMNL